MTSRTRSVTTLNSWLSCIGTWLTRRKQESKTSEPAPSTRLRSLSACARWTAWQGEDSLHEMAFGEPPLEPRRDTWRDWLYLFTVIGRPEFIAQFLVLISLSALILLVLHWIFGIPLGPSHPIAK